MAVPRQIGADNAIRQLAHALELDGNGLVTTMVARMGDEVEELDVHAHPELRASVRASCEGNLRAFIEALRSDREPPRPAPVEALEGARVPARAGVSLESVLHTYRVGHAVVWERLVEKVHELRLEEDARHALLGICSRCMFAYVDSVSALVTREYTHERERWLGSGAQHRARLVREVIRGAAVDSGELGYDLDAEHLAVIVGGADPAGYVGTLKREADHDVLTVAVGEHTIWGWLGSRRPFGKRQLAAMARDAVPARTTVAFGEPAVGPAGFRRSHEQALDAHRVAVRRPNPVTRYDDVALESALLADERAARCFLERELRDLDGADRRSAELRRTLEAYLGTGLNASSAAALLGINDRTVAYRIRAIETQLGLAVTTRAPELAAALRIRRLNEGRLAQPPGA